MIVRAFPHPDYPNQTWRIDFKNKGASANICILGDETDTAFLYDVFSTHRHKGDASALIREIDRFCVEHEIMLIVEADVYDAGWDGIRSNEVLRSWYEKNGAHFIGNNDNGVPILLLGYDSDQGE